MGSLEKLNKVNKRRHELLKIKRENKRELTDPELIELEYLQEVSGILTDKLTPELNIGDEDD